jgi:hypothetical protein
MTALECVEQNGFAIIRDVLSGQDITGVLSDFEDATLRHSRAGVRHAFDSVLPATHNLGVLDDDTMHTLAAQIAPIDCLVARGGVLAMRPLLVHASSKSQAAAPRRVLHIEYAASAVLSEKLLLAVAGSPTAVGAVK